MQSILAKLRGLAARDPDNCCATAAALRPSFVAESGERVLILN